MPKQRSYEQPDADSVLSGDRGWIGVNMRLDPSQLPPGVASEAINMRFPKGIPETRKGPVKLVWTNRPFIEGTITRAGGTATFTAEEAHGFASGDTVTVYGANETEYNIKVVIVVTGTLTFTYAVAGTPASPATGFPSVTKTNVYPWGDVHGVGVFSSPTTFVKYAIIAARGRVYYTFANNHPRRIPLPAMVTLTGQVRFEQAFDKLVMFRGEDEAPLQMADINVGFAAITQTQNSEATGVENIPNADRGLFFQNRLVIAHGNDEVALSDIGDYTHFVPTLQDFKINQGSADKLVNMVKFNDTTLVCFKDHSIYAIYNVYGDLAAVQQDELTHEFGLKAPESVAHVGSDLWFLSELGVMSIAQTDQNKLQGVVLPVSEPIQPLIDRINWRYAQSGDHGPGAVSSYHDNKYYLAVPLDDGELLGPELIPLGDYTNPVPSNNYTVPNLVIGKTYRWQQATDLGGTETLVCGSLTLTHDGDFVAPANTAVITITGTNLIASSLRHVTKGVNNAVLVYDFLANAWAGYDQQDGFDVRQWVQYEYNGVRRLFAVTSAGYVMLYEEDFEDQLLEPYTDVTFAANPANGNTIKVNGGTLVTADTSLTNNTAALWAANPATTLPKYELWGNPVFNGGYSPAVPNKWTSPSTLPVAILGDGDPGDLTNYLGVRFYSTNGVIPSVVTTGAWPVVLEYGTQQITSTFVTRAYSPDQGQLQDFYKLELDLQTWNPKYSISLLTPGVSEEFPIATDKTKDRTQWYRPHGKPDFDPTNVNDDFEDAYRQDYSVLLGPASSGGVAAQIQVDGSLPGIGVDRHQEARETFRLLSAGRNARIKIVNTQGRIRVMQLKLQGRAETQKAGTAA